MSAYQRFAELYDRLTFDVDYEAIAARIDGIFEREEKKPELVLDLACGTGTCASVVAAVLNGFTERDVLVHLLGGDLEIHWDEKDNHVYMTGSATTVFDGEIDLP